MGRSELPYLVKFTDEGMADVGGLPKNIRNSLKKEIRGKLAVDPYGHSLELHEPLQGWRSFRYRNYRVVFKIYGDLRAIAIAGIGKRLPQSKSDIYKRLQTLATEGRLAEKILAGLRGFTPPGSEPD